MLNFVRLKLVNLIKDWFPPYLLRLIRNYRGGAIVFNGPFSTWKEASLHSSGYDSEKILEKVLAATLKVKNGEAAFERDSVLFDEIQYSWPVTSALMWAAARNNGKLNVLDIGGALGSSYFQNRVFLEGLSEVNWQVIEQENFVEAGKKYIQNERITFYSSINCCLQENKPNVVLLSSVLQYLENPLKIFEELTKIGADVLIVDRTPFSFNEYDKICVQKVSKRIYDASYPMWIFSKSKFMSTANKDWRLVYEEVSPEGAFSFDKTKFTFLSMIFERRK